VFENRALSFVFGPPRGVIIEGWKDLHNKELYIFYSSPNTIIMMKSRKIWARYVAGMG
jgi:hypothetical protein